MPERFKVVFTMQGAIQLLGFTFTFSALIRRHAKFEVAEPIHCDIITFLMLIHYFTL